MPDVGGGITKKTSAAPVHPVAALPLGKPFGWAQIQAGRFIWHDVGVLEM